MDILLVLAHPDPESFNHAIAQTAGHTLRELGHRVTFLDLYAEGFDAVLRIEEIPRDAKLPPQAARHCEALAHAEGIVVVHPNWWGQPPALLKGWIDRIVRPGVAYEFLEGDGGEGVPRGLLQARTAVVFNTSNTPADRERESFGDPLESIWKRCVFGLCGVPDVRRRTFGVVVTSSPDERAGWLRETARIVSAAFPRDGRAEADDSPAVGSGLPVRQSTEAYVHGYAKRESERLLDQACALTDLLHSDTRYPEGSRVLEAGCGVGAQTVILAGNSPGARLTSVDLSESSLHEAARRVAAAGFGNVVFRQADLYDLPFEDDSFDHVFVCFVLEHLRDPVAVLTELRRVLSPGGSLTAIEGDHGSAFFHPDSVRARRAIECLSALQAEAGGDARIGRRLYPLLRSAGFPEPRISPRTVYADAGRPEQVEGFTRNTFIAMVEGVREQAIGSGKLTAEEWDAAVGDLYRAAGPGGTFAYTFFKGVAVK